MRNRLLIIVSAALVVITGACAHPVMNNVAGYDRNVITFDQLEGVRDQTAWDAIRKVRPAFLMSRGPVTLLGSASQYPSVYVDGMRYGGIETLRQIPASWIAEVRLDRVASSAFIARNELSGIIQITTRRR